MTSFGSRGKSSARSVAVLAVGSNVLVRVLARDDARQAVAADQAVAEEAWVSHLVLAEAAWVISAVHARTAKQLIAASNLLLAHETLVLQDADVVAGALAQYAGESMPAAPSRPSWHLLPGR